MSHPQVKGHCALFTQFEFHTWFFFLLTHLVLQTCSSHVLKRFSTYTSGLSRPPVTAAPSAATDRDREVLFSPLPGLPVNAPATGNHNGGARFSVLPNPPSPPPLTHPTQPFLLCFLFLTLVLMASPEKFVAPKHFWASRQNSVATFFSTTEAAGDFISNVKMNNKRQTKKIDTAHLE